MAHADDIRNALRENFGFDCFKEKQLEIISDLLDGKDVFVLMPTGGGKSLCYQLPAMMSDGTAIVISPLIALMKNQVDAIRSYSGDESRAHFLNSSLSRSAARKVRDDVLGGRTKLLFVAPESLTKEDNIRFFKQVNISFYAVDEAHCISEWGHDFRPEYRRIRDIIDSISRRPIIALTATATPKVQHDIRRNLRITDSQVYKLSFNRPNLFYEVRPKTNDVDAEVIKFIKSNPGKSGIVYCLSRKKVEQLAEILRINNISVHPYHAGMDAARRAAYQDDFLQEKVDVIVATIAFGMGIDKPDVRYVIHYEMPKSLEGYYQETGRSGRDGGEGHCIAFYSNKDLQKLDKLMQGKTATELEIGRQLLLETARYAESSVCRRKILLSYFGERYEGENCGCCDNCVHPRKRVEARRELAVVLEAVRALGEKHKSEYMVAFLTGRATDEIRHHGHDRLPLFGALADIEDRFLNALIQQSTIAGYLRREIENYGILHLTPDGENFIRNPQSFLIVEASDFSGADYDLPADSDQQADTNLIEQLKSVRDRVARRAGVPGYVIARDAVIEHLARSYPMTVDELMNFPGFGPGKAAKFGREFADVISRYVSDHNVERNEEIKVKMIADRGKQKFHVIQGVDRKLNLEDLADSRGLSFDELIDELEAIVESGTLLDITYYINEILEEERQEEIEDYMRSLDRDDLDAVCEEFGDEYTDQELRLMRVKLLSSW